MADHELFSRLVKAINDFQTDIPIIKEAQLERIIKTYLTDKGFKIESQVTKRKDRYDLISKSDKETVCIELKIKTNPSDFKQFDRYLRKFKDGFIIICWQASRSMQIDFENVKEQSPIPIELFELSRRYA